MISDTAQQARLHNVFSVAPMMDWTDRYCRVFHRVLTKKALLYTEMVTTGALIFGPRERLLRHSSTEQPVALQLGGSNPNDLATCAAFGAEAGYNEINLNCGCPSDRVQNGSFGAVLMKSPALVAECVRAMKDAVSIPVTVKCRIGVDDQEPQDALFAISEAVFEAGADALIVHARKAWLQGLSPKENRDVPPLDYALVHRLKAAWPHRIIAINGGITSLSAAREQLDHVDGVMLGRAAYQEPWRLLDVDHQIFGNPNPMPDAFAAIDALVPLIEAEMKTGTRLHAFTRHMVGLFQAVPGARRYRQHLSTHASRPDADWRTLVEAAAFVARPNEVEAA
jgi:tRNA-dihydrouridine synthase A